MLQLSALILVPVLFFQFLQQANIPCILNILIRYSRSTFLVDIFYNIVLYILISAFTSFSNPDTMHLRSVLRLIVFFIYIICTNPTLSKEEIIYPFLFAEQIVSGVLVTKFFIHIFPIVRSTIA